MSRTACRLALILACSQLAATFAVAAAPTTPEERAALAAQRKQIADARKQAASRDVTEAVAGINALHAIGDPAARDTLVAVKRLLTRDQRTIESALRKMGDIDALNAAMQEQAELQVAAGEHIKKLTKDAESQRIAKENYEKLDALMTKLNAVYAVRLQLAEAISRRDALLVVLRDVQPATDKSFSQEKEADLKQRVVEAMGMSVDQLSTLPDIGGKAPGDLALRTMWLYKVSRQIEAQNATLQGKHLSPAEYDNLVIMNNYRESLGRMPYEADPRLQQSARRHSKEMVDKGYFSHTSPTPANKSHTKRMSNAGYKGGYSENIAMGMSSGSTVFWAWFSSPPHHRNMVNPGSTQAGIGKWRSKWTQNFGRAGRHLAKGTDPLTVEVKGEFLEASSSGGTAGGRGAGNPYRAKGAEKYRPKAENRPGNRR